MKIPFPDIVEKGRMSVAPYLSERGEPFGAFALQYSETVVLAIVANAANPDSDWWEHVSVSAHGRTPTWDEMCWVKDLFWKEDECVVQYHPPKSEYVNCHPNCLHLWRSIRKKIPIPPSYLVGPK